VFHENWTKDLLIVLATAGVVVPIFGRFKVGVVPGFLIAGFLLGPTGLGRFVADLPWLSAITFSSPERVEPFAELGVLFLLFLIGLEFSVDRLWKMRRLVFAFGSAQFFVSVLAILAGGIALGLDFDDALVIALALSLSSTAIVTQVLIEARRFVTPVGQASLGVLLYQDLMVVPIIIVVGLLGGEDVAVSGAVMRAIAFAAIMLAFILLAGRFLGRPLLRLAAATGSRELIVAIALFLAIGTSLLTGLVGLSPALGAFLAGLLLSESEYRHQLEVDIEPVKGLLLGLFFMTVGMSFHADVLTSQPVFFAGALLALLLVKIVVVFVVAQLVGLDRPLGIETAFLLAGGGEFAFVVMTLAAGERLLEPSVHSFVVSVAALSMLLTPLLAFAGRKLAADLRERKADAEDGVGGLDRETLADHVVIGGFGRVGQTVARILDAEGIPYVALDLSPSLIARKRKEGQPVFFGDAGRHEILERVAADRARAFVVTTDKREATERMVRAILERWPDTPIHARALDVDHAQKLASIGVPNVVPEALEGSLQLARRLLIGFGIPDEAVDARLDVARNSEIGRLSSNPE